jgi:hypothetical protein
MKVRATQVGYYEHMRRFPADYAHFRAGEVFTLKKDEDYSAKWMEIVEGGPAAKPGKVKGSKPVVQEQKPEIEEPTGDTEVI